MSDDKNTLAIMLFSELLAADHAITKVLGADDPLIDRFARDCAAAGNTEEEIEKAPKKGIDLGVKVLHPFDKNWEIPTVSGHRAVLRHEWSISLIPVSKPL